MGLDQIYIGQLDTRIEIFLSSNAVASSTGETQKNDVSVGECQARVEDNGGEEEEDGKIYYSASKTFVTRYIQEVQEDGERMFVRLNGKDYDIYSVEVVGRNRFLKLKATKRE